MNELKLGKIISINQQPFVVTYTQHVQMGRGSAVLRSKLKNLITGQVLEKTFKHGDKLEEADLSHSKADFLYREGDTFYFMDNTSFEQFGLEAAQVGELSNFVKEGSDVDVMNFDGKPVSIELPIKVEYKVTESPPGIRGDSGGSVTKKVTLETGLVVDAPLFIAEGETA